MRRHTARSQQPGVRPDGLPNRAMKRKHPSAAANATFRAFSTWYFVASMLIPGYVPTEQTEEKAA